MPRVKFADRGGARDYWLSKPGGDANLLDEFSRVIRCKVKPIPNTRNRKPTHAHEGQFNVVVSFDEPDRLKKYPFLFMTGETNYTLNLRQQKNLQEYIYQGGFLLRKTCPE